MYGHRQVAGGRVPQIGGLTLQ
ncbi:hypothetical protein ID866_7286 [Astraeus odoratus]|nr:hypothetical protein ID866_7286 [Astraeus odoratus]